jgi:hypothetical protein
MSTRDALIREIMKQPEPLLRELHHYLDYLVEQRNVEANGAKGAGAAKWPDRYFERTAGAFAHEPLERPAQLPVENGISGNAFLNLWMA